LSALVPPLHALAIGAAAAHSLPAAPGQERRPARDDDRHARLPSLPVRPRLQPLSLRLLSQRGALPRGLRGAGLPRAVPGRGHPAPGGRASRATPRAPAAAGDTPCTPSAASAAATIRAASIGSRRRAPAS